MEKAVFQKFILIKIFQRSTILQTRFINFDTVSIENEIAENLARADKNFIRPPQSPKTL